MRDFLKEIIEVKEKRLIEQKKILPFDILKDKLKRIEFRPRDFNAAISQSEAMSFIAELKKASPSGGVLRGDFNPLSIVREFEEGGVSAISILTEKDFFQGGEGIVPRAREMCDMPILAKDFIIDEYQFYLLKFYGADCILLIAKILDEDELSGFLEITRHLGLQALVEVHDEKDIAKALKCGAEMIGINNRNLEDFQVDLKTTERLYKLIPGGKVIVSESGISRREDVEYMASIGVDAVLVGEAFMRAKDIRAKLRELMEPGD